MPASSVLMEGLLFHWQQFLLCFPVFGVGFANALFPGPSLFRNRNLRGEFVASIE